MRQEKTDWPTQLALYKEGMEARVKALQAHSETLEDEKTMLENEYNKVRGSWAEMHAAATAKGGMHMQLAEAKGKVDNLQLQVADFHATQAALRTTQVRRFVGVAKHMKRKYNILPHTPHTPHRLRLWL